MRINRFTLMEFMEDEGLGVTDLAQRTREQDPTGKGVSVSFLSELRSGTKTEVSPAVVKKIAVALNRRVRALALRPDDDELEAVN